MGEFFKGWRRKIGCVALVMALVFMGGWVRSTVVQDEVRISLGYLPLFFNSCNGTLTWWQLHQLDAVPAYSFALEWRCTTETRGRTFSFSKYVTPQQGKTENPTGVFVERAKWGPMLINWTADYWSFTIPLTVLSAYLLIWPGKQATSGKSPQSSDDHSSTCSNSVGTTPSSGNPSQ